MREVIADIFIKSTVFARLQRRRGSNDEILTFSSETAELDHAVKGQILDDPPLAVSILSQYVNLFPVFLLTDLVWFPFIDVVIFRIC